MNEREKTREENTGTPGEHRALRRCGASGSLQGGPPGPERSWAVSACQAARASQPPPAPPAAPPARPSFAGRFFCEKNSTGYLPGKSGRWVPSQPKPLGAEDWAACSFSAQSCGVVFKHTISSRAPTPGLARGPARRTGLGRPPDKSSPGLPLPLGVRRARGARGTCGNGRLSAFSGPHRRLRVREEGGWSGNPGYFPGAWPSRPSRIRCPTLAKIGQRRRAFLNPSLKVLRRSREGRGPSNPSAESEFVQGRR